MTHVLTFDIEDWYHPTLTNNSALHSYELETRVVEPTLRIINMLEETENKATFFVLGEVAEKFPELVQEMTAKGHEVASHGYSHDLVYDNTRYQFETDIERSVEILERATNKKVLGYRAPSWSLNWQTPWAWEVLRSFDFQYDSSLYPFRTYLYGDNNAPRFAYDIELQNGDTILEIPPSAAEIAGRRVPFAGGFFMRVAPIWFIQWAMNQYNRKANPAVMYLHPWEIDVEQPRLKLSRKDRFIMYSNIEKTEEKLRKLLESYRFDSIRNFFSVTTDRQKVRSQVTVSAVRQS